MSYANRPYFIDARAGAQRPVLRRRPDHRHPRGWFISAPVRHDGRVNNGVVAVKLSLKAITAAWAQARDPIVVTDERGIVVAGLGTRMELPRRRGV